MAFTDQQKFVLQTLDQAESLLNTHEIAEAIRKKFRDTPHGYYDRTNAVLRRLAERGLVERVKTAGKVSSWKLTEAGKAALV